MMKQAQLKMAESIAVLIVFFFLILFGFIFYTKTQQTTMTTEREEILDVNSIQVAQLVSHLPELQCSSENIVSDNCIDIYKLSAFENIANLNQQYYYPFFYYSAITVEEIYPGNSTWILYNRSLEETGQRVLFVPISLYNATARSYQYGVLTVMYYPFTQRT